MHFWEDLGQFFYTFYHIFAALISLAIIAAFVVFHWRHVRLYKRLFSRLLRKDPARTQKTCDRTGKCKKGVTLIFGSEKLLNHKDEEIADMARNCRSLMVHQIILAVAFAVIYALLTTIRYHIFT